MENMTREMNEKLCNISSQITNLSTTVQIHESTNVSSNTNPKKRGGPRNCVSFKPSYVPYIRNGEDVPSLKTNSVHPDVTLGYKFETIQICNEWIKAQVCIIMYVLCFVNID